MRAVGSKKPTRFSHILDEGDYAGGSDANELIR